MRQRLFLLMLLLAFSIVGFSEIINFADVNVKQICIQNWDTNGDGELSDTEAAAVTDLGDVFKNNTNVTSFNELQYFTGLTAIGESAFNGCTGLTSVTIPNGVTAIGDFAFAGCDFTSFTLPASVTSLGDNIVWLCHSLSALSVNADNTVYDSRNNCNAIIKTATNELVSGISNTVIPSTVTSIGEAAFSGIHLESITIPDGVTSIGHSAFAGNDFTEITIPSSVTSMTYHTFNCDNLVTVTVGNPTPIAIEESTFTNRANATLIVPVGSISAYKAATYWSQFKTIQDTNGSTVDTDRTINVATAGTLSTLITAEVKNVITSLTLTGNLNGDDLRFLREMAGNSYDGNPTEGKLSYLDMSGATIVAGGKYMQLADDYIHLSNSGMIGVYNNDPFVSADNTLGDYVFAGCGKLETIKMPTSVVTVGGFAFSDCELTTIVWPTALTSIGMSAFSGNRFTSFTLPASVTSLGSNIIAACSLLSSLSVESGNTVYDSRDNCNAIIKTSTNELLSAIPATTIPSTVTSIGDDAFVSLGLTSIDIPNSVTSIGNDAFNNNQFTSVTIPANVTSIGNGAFRFCDDLTSITVGASTPIAISEYTFTEANYNATLYVPRGSIEAYQAADYWKEFATIEEYEILEATIDGLRYEYYTSSKTATVVHDDSYEGNLKRVEIPATITIDEVEYRVTSIGDEAFSGCNSLLSVVIPEGVISIGEKSIMWCCNLSKVVLPSTITSIGEGAFASSPSSGPRIISYITEPFAISDIVFGVTDTWSSDNTNVTEPSPATLYVPVGTKSKYEALSGWNKFAKIEEGELLDAAIDGLHYECYTNSKTATVVLGDNYRDNLTNAEIPSKITVDEVEYDVTAIGDEAFYVCSGLTSVTIPNSVTSIGFRAFRNCFSLESITIPNSVTSIDDEAFYNCGFRSLTIPNSVTSIGKDAFSMCILLNSIVVEEGNTKYDSRDNCNALIETATNTLMTGCPKTVIPNSVTSIGENAFKSCGLLSIIIPEGVECVGKSAFEDCHNMSRVVLPSTITSIGEKAFVSSSSNVLNVISHITEPFAISDNVFGVSTAWPNLHSEPSTATLCVPVGTKSKYEALSGWNKFATIEEGEILEATIDGLKYEYYTGSKTATVIRDDSYVDLTSVEIPATITVDEVEYDVTGIGKKAFSIWNLTSITIPGSVTSIGDYAFSDSRLQTVIIPEGVESIGKGAFLSCSNLSKVVLPSTLRSIGEGAFVVHQNQYSYESVPNIVSYIAEPFAVSDNTFGVYNSWYVENTDSSPKTLFVPVGTKSKYEALSGWNKFATIEEGEILETTIDGLHYEYRTGSKTATVIHDDSYQSLESIEIPATITIDEVQYDVTEIGKNAFFECGNLNSVLIPNSVISIGNEAFHRCWKLSSITIPGNVTSIGDEAFRDCMILTSITIPNSVTSIGEGAFFQCRLTSITIPKSVTSIGKDAFMWCKNLTSLVVEDGNTKYDSRDNCNAIIETATNTLLFGCKGSVIPNSVTSIGDYAFHGSGLQSVTIPESVTSIGQCAFMYCSDLSKVELPSTITSIGEGAFVCLPEASSVPHVISHITEPFAISNNVFGFSNVWSVPTTDPLSSTLYVPVGSKSKYEALSGWNKFAAIEEGENLEATIDGLRYEYYTSSKTATVIHDGSYSGLTSVEIPATITVDEEQYDVTEVGDRAFYQCSLTSVTIPNSVTSIGYSAFSNCSNLTSIICYAENVPTTDAYAFVYANIENATLYVPEGSIEAYRSAAPWSGFKRVLVIGAETPDLEYTDAQGVKYTLNDGGNTYSVCGHTDACTGAITIPASVNGCSVTAIGDFAFNDCTDLTSVTIPSSVTSIGDGAFSWCGLTSIIIPKSVTSIGYLAFNFCYDLTSIIVEAGNSVYDSRDNSNAIIETASNTLIVGCPNTTIPNSVTYIGNEAFKSCTGLTSVTIPNSVISIGDLAFYGCTGLTSVTIPNSVTSIGTTAFSWCGLTSISISNSVTSIGEYAFHGCNGLTSVTIPCSLTSIGATAFSCCNSLTSITVEACNSVYDSRDNSNAIIETANNTLVIGCQNTTIPASVTSIGDNAFSACFDLTSITIPASVTSIGDNSFSGCGLTSMTIPGSVTSIGSEAFRWCPIENVYCYAEVVPNTDANAFLDSNIGNATLYVPAGSVEAYTATVPWSGFKEIVAIADQSVSDLFKGSYLWASYVAEEDLAVPTGLTAYVITDMDNSSAIASQIAYIPQGVPVLLKRDDATINSYTFTSGTGTPPTTNLLKAYTEDKTVANREGYVLFRDEFVLVSEGTLPAGKVFLPVYGSDRSGVAYARGIVVRGGGLTDIDDMKVDSDQSDEVWYDLQGRKLEKKPTKKGVYILNGRKMIVK